MREAPDAQDLAQAGRVSAVVAQGAHLQLDQGSGRRQCLHDALDHSANRRWAVAPNGPDEADGSCCHAQPDVVTHTIAAGTSRSP